MKRVFPVVWFGFIVVVAGTALVAALGQGARLGELVFFLVPVLVAMVGFMVMKRFIWDLVDEVEDHGDYLLVRNRGDEARIDLANIMNVSATTFVNPPRITLRLRQSIRFGTDVSFSPVRPFTLNPFARNEVAEDLIVRVDRARSK
jgi:hypothetical protein